MYQPQQFFIPGTPRFPSNSLPVLYYPKVLILPPLLASRAVRKLFLKHDWGNNWRDGVLTYHHYHSNTHECTAVIKGGTTLLLGGEFGTKLEISRGDVLIIPAGVAHCNIGKMGDLTCVGGYPGGKDYDIKRGEEGERPGVDVCINDLAVPSSGPVYGNDDPLISIWNKINTKNKV